MDSPVVTTSIQFTKVELEVLCMLVLNGDYMFEPDYEPGRHGFQVTHEQREAAERVKAMCQGMKE